MKFITFWNALFYVDIALLPIFVKSYDPDASANIEHGFEHNPSLQECECVYKPQLCTLCANRPWKQQVRPKARENFSRAWTHRINFLANR